MSPICIRTCPICREAECDFIHRQEFTLPEGHPMTGGYAVVCCKTCGLVYADTSISQVDCDKIYGFFSKYGDSSTSTGGGDSQWDRARLVKTADRIAQYLPDKNSSILDIGCAGGGLLGALNNLGYTKLCGLDPSLACVAQTNSRRGIKALQGTFSDIPTGLGTFDCIILSHVLEHLLDLGAAVRDVYRLLKPGGLLYAEVPDATHYDGFIKAPFQEFNTEHINYFSIPCLRRLLITAGLEERATGQKIILSSIDTAYPVIYAVYEKSDQPSKNPLPQRDESLRRQIEEYVKRSQKIMDQIEVQLRNILADNPELIIWGAGQLAMKLFGNTSLAQAGIAAIVDGNPVNQGQKLKGMVISAPEQIREMKNPILITSILHHTEITDVIRNRIGMNNPILSLLPRAGSGTTLVKTRTSVDYGEDVEDILAENPTDARQRSATEFDEWLSQNNGPLILFGAGALGRKILGCLRQDGIEPIGFADNDPAKWGRHIGDLQIWPPEEAVRNFPDASFVVTIRSPGHGYRESHRQLVNAGCERVLPLLPVLWKYPGQLLPHYGLDLPQAILAHVSEIKKAFLLMADE
ncbi:MAG: hypothetical protein CVU61_10290 [Deltaproteobacteria bacterium HGW-Deltaproteobacteria-19]|nr:MAG: hypothetical protein CVU61_10290 [Deltaproteobacteria bacterium HGW-Deltaproteobacteria-19]